MPVLRLLHAHSTIAYFASAMVFAGLANGLAFFVLWRMRRLGHRVGILRTLGKDWALYRAYWRVAPEQNWSRIPLIIGPISFVLAGCLLFMSVCGMQIPR